MPRVTVNEFLTLDGVMQAPGQPDEDTSGNFRHGAWHLPYNDDRFVAALMDALQGTDGLLLGRRTYEIFAAHWPHQPADDPLAAIFNTIPKYVVTRTLEEPFGWDKTVAISDNVLDEVRRLRAGPGGELQVIGSGQLTRTLVRHNLVDEFRLMVHPLLLGTGRRLFDDETDHLLRLRLLDATPTTTGVLILRYEPADA
jgi:dihydrofolate reductase